MNQKTTKSLRSQDRTHGGRRRHRSGCCSAVAAGLPRPRPPLGFSDVSWNCRYPRPRAACRSVRRHEGSATNFFIVTTASPNKDAGQTVYTAPTDLRMAPPDPDDWFAKHRCPELEGITTTRAATTSLQPRPL